MSLASLHGRRVLLVYEDGFQASYLADVIASSGAMVIRTAGIDVSLLDGDPLCAVVLGGMTADTERFAVAAASQGAVTLLLRFGRDGELRRACHDHVLTAPYAGFQVVDALAYLLRERERARPDWSGPHRREH